MVNILCIETTTTNCSVAIAQDGKLLLLEEDMGLKYSHAERLHPYITKVLEKSNLSMSDLDAIAVSKGPGSYTGLRIGVSSAKGLCYSLNIPLLSIDTLQSLAKQADANQDFIVPLLDARRMEVYSAVFDKKFNQLRGIEAEIIDETSFSLYLEKGKTVFIGNGVEKLKQLIDHPNAIFNTKALPSAREMVALANHKFEIGDIEDVAYFEPYYLKDFLVAKPKN